MNQKFKIVKDDIFIYDSLPDETIICQDMYQAVCEPYVIDCGWYGHYEGGNFVTFLIKDVDWENPVLKILTPNFSDAKWSINACKEYIGSAIQ